MVQLLSSAHWIICCLQDQTSTPVQWLHRTRTEQTTFQQMRTPLIRYIAAGTTQQYHYISLFPTSTAAVPHIQRGVSTPVQLLTDKTL